MNTAVDANLNNVNCLVTKTHLGYDTIINICTNHSQNIAWTWADWFRVASMGFVGLLVLGSVIVLCVFGYLLITDQ